MDMESARRQSRLTGRVAVVVGSGTTGDVPGTGSATAALFAAQGAAVVVVGRSDAHTSRTVELIQAAGGVACAVLADATLDADCARVVAEAVEQFGGLDVLVNNLGSTESTTIEDFDEQVWHRVVATNLTSVLLMTKHALPHLKASPAPSVVNVGSIAGVQSGGGIPYGTTKGAVMVLTRDLAAKLGPLGVRVNCVVPGHLATAMGLRSAPHLQELRSQLSMLRTDGTGWDVAWAALFLACEESRFITGVSLPVDGGVTASLALSTLSRILAEHDQ